ncbi:hypothetical protein H6G81_14475 [Scytonema hofmannii FACHB-248]|uniref:Uncharacterized protein n=1 Tax=Scytonema hofmannii FACHB-248 TaxID=1842502 RepID=A0ABR8GR75_9CYAN|nr:MULTISPECIES: hypothetical protein [Nostocales]MBD2605699.1 hypothetical protein [Scytonema hofmannii FACHB-248]
MNYQKLDAPLSMALKDVENTEEPSLQVFIHTKPVSNAETTVLENLGVSGITTGKDVFTATLSPSAISQLSDQPWVEHVKLSQTLHLANQGYGMKRVRLL